MNAPMHTVALPPPCNEHRTQKDPGCGWCRADIAAAKPALAVLTNSRAKTARSCPRRHDIEYRQGYRPVGEADELTFGTLVHACLAAWWVMARAGVDVSERLKAALEQLETEAAKKLDPYTLARAQVMVVGYHARWAVEPFEVVSVEQQFTGPLINPDTGHVSKLWLIGGKLDVLVRHIETGCVWLMEHKTSSEDLSPGGTYVKRLRLDTQISTYLQGAALLGFDAVGCIYDVLSKPAIRPLKATPDEAKKYTAKGVLYANQRAEDETPLEYSNRLVEAVTAEPSQYFARIEVPRLQAEVEEAQRDLWQQAQRIREDERMERAPRNPDSCLSYGRVCPFFAVCCGEASLDDERLYRRVQSVHPELVQP